MLLIRLSTIIVSLLIICRESLSVFQLNETSFDSVTKALTGENGDWLVRFYAPWCTYSREMLPAWENAETQLKGFVRVGDVDAIANRYNGTNYSFHDA